MGLCYETSRWTDRLWSEHLGVSPAACEHVQAGIGRQGARFADFANDLHARLYLPRDPAAIDGAPEWATKLHEQASELGEWQRLRAMCARNGFAAGIATEALLEGLLPLVPEASQERQDGQGGGQGQGGEAVRAAIRRATRAARDAVQEAEGELEGVATALGGSMAGQGFVSNGGPANLAAVRDAHARLQGSTRLRRIAELAGRLERLAAAKAKSTVKPGVGEVHGIDQGNDLARLLPSELVSLRHPRLRLALLSKIVQHRALCYGMKGKETQARGPIVVLLDESASMLEQGKAVWSKAVCLALLSTATRQKRAWHLIAFNGKIRREVEVSAGQATAKLISDALDNGCAGGTDFDAPVLRAAEIIRTAKAMRKADVVIITDGEDDLEPETVAQATTLTRLEGVSWFVVGVGDAAASGGLKSLAPIATSTVAVRDTEDGNDAVVPVINLEV